MHNFALAIEYCDDFILENNSSNDPDKVYIAKTYASLKQKIEKKRENYVKFVQEQLAVPHYGMFGWLMGSGTAKTGGELNHYLTRDVDTLLFGQDVIDK
jgi:hypothetical protein